MHPLARNLTLEIALSIPVSKDEKYKQFSKISVIIHNTACMTCIDVDVYCSPVVSSNLLSESMLFYSPGVSIHQQLSKALHILFELSHLIHIECFI